MDFDLQRNCLYIEDNDMPNFEHRQWRRISRHQLLMAGLHYPWNLQFYLTDSISKSAMVGF